MVQITERFPDFQIFFNFSSTFAVNVEFIKGQMSDCTVVLESGQEGKFYVARGLTEKRDQKINETVEENI